MEEERSHHQNIDQKLHWHALYTKPRFEKRVHEELLKKEIESYLPLQTVLRQWSDRKKKIDEPLFRSYVFVHVIPKKRSEILSLDGIVRMVGFGGKPSIIPDDQIDALKRFLKEGVSVHSYDYLVKGDWVEVTHGPFAGIKGQLVEKRNEQRFVVSIDAIRQSIAVEIDPFLLRRFEKHVSNEY